MDRFSPDARAAGAEPVSAQSAWSNVAPTYATTFARYTSLAIEPLLDDAEITPGCSLLDLACGPGLAAAAAAQRGARVTGADFSHPMAKLARAAMPGAPVVQADAHALPWRAAAFDAVVANFGVHTFAEPLVALREVVRVLRSGGRLVFSVWEAAERSEAERLLVQAVRARGDRAETTPKASELADPAFAATMLASAGFGAPRTRALELTLRGANGEEIFEIFRTGTIRLASYLARQSPDTLVAIRAEYVRLLAPWTSAAGVAVSMRAVLHAARRP